jgi:hypothetical protein
MRRFLGTSADRRFFVTTDGHMGLGPFAMEEGDIVTVLFGGAVPYLLRRMGADYWLVGECYVHGIIEGQVIEQLRDKGELAMRTKEFRLV